MDKLNAQGTYQLIVALRKSTIDFSSIPSDIIYMLYLNVVKHIAHFDVFDLSHILNLMTDPVIQEHVPEAFWNKNIPEALEASFTAFEQNKKDINPGMYFHDVISCLVSFSLSPQ